MMIMSPSFIAPSDTIEPSLKLDRCPVVVITLDVKLTTTSSTSSSVSRRGSESEFSPRNNLSSCHGFCSEPQAATIVTAYQASS